MNQSLSDDLNDFRVDNSLADLNSLSWSNRSISIPDSGVLTGTANLKNGQNIPLTVLFAKEGEHWRIYSIRKATTGIVDVVDGEELPSEKDLIRFSQKTTNRFLNAIKMNDFSSFYGAISHAWRLETSPEEFSQAFRNWRQFYEKEPAYHPYFKSLENMAPILTKQPLIDRGGILVVSGKYNTTPLFTFTYKYVFEGLGWKLIGVKGNL